MSFYSLTTNRHSVRSFSDKMVSDETIQKILDMARTAPSAGDLKAYEIVAMTDAEQRGKVSRAAGAQAFIKDAPVLFVFVACPEISSKKYGDRGERLYALQDATIACAYTQLAAADLGLGSCWVGAFNEEEVRRVLRLKEMHTPVALLPVGYEK